MIAACAPFDPLGRYVGSILAWVDCRTMGLGEEAFRALGPGSPFGAALTGLLTIYVALIGYRLLLGGELTVRDGMSAPSRSAWCWRWQLNGRPGGCWFTMSRPRPRRP